MRKKLILCLLSLLLICPILAEAAGTPYSSYTYDEWNRSVGAPTGYTVEETILGSLQETGTWSKPQDLCVTPQETILLADTGNNRILEYDRNWKLIREITEVGSGSSKVVLNGPTGLFVSADGKLYIAMQGAAQALKTDLKTLEVELVIQNLQHALLGEDFTFAPSKIGADNAGRIYVLSVGCYSGLLQFSPQGSFMGYYGSNKVTVTMEVLLQSYWKSIMTDEQRANMTSILPVEYSNLHCAPDGFVYACTVGTQTPVNQVKRLNPLGNNTYLARGDREINFGDDELATVKSAASMVTLMPTFVDVATTQDCEFIFAVDRSYGRVFERDRNGSLITVFGSLGDQEGTFRQPAAIDVLGDRVLVLDSLKNSIAVFKPTDYTSLVHEAVSYYNAGEYEKSREVWEKVIRRNTNATQAYAGVGRALLKEKRYEEALTYYRQGNSREEYSQAYRIVRLNAIRSAALPAVCILVGVILIWKLVSWLIRRKGGHQKRHLGGKLLDKLHLSRNTQFPRVLTHPFAGFSDIRFGEKVALWPSFLILALYAIATIYQFVGTGYLFNKNNIADINLWLLLAKSIGVVLIFFAAQWSMGILTNGSGRVRDMFITTCYSLAPYTVALLIGTMLSNYLILEEPYAEYVILFGLIWSVILLLVGTMIIHELTFVRTLGFLALTVAAMLVIVFVAVLFYTLFLQLCTFFYTLYVEIVFRM